MVRFSNFALGKKAQQEMCFERIHFFLRNVGKLYTDLHNLVLKWRNSEWMWNEMIQAN